MHFWVLSSFLCSYITLVLGVFTQYIQYAATGHARVIRNLEARDEAWAEMEIRLHIHRVVNDIEAILKFSGDQGRDDIVSLVSEF